MIRVHRISLLCVLEACLLVPAGLAAGANDAAAKPDAKPAEAAAPAKDQKSAKDKKDVKPAAKPKRELTPAQATLRDLVREVLAAHQKDPFSLQSNSATEIMDYCLGFGCSTEVLTGDANSQRINGITSLCYNYPCAGFDMLGISGKHLAPRVGYGSQERPGEFLAMLALSRVPAEYPIRLGRNSRTVADLVQAEKLGCRSGTDMSLKLIGLSFYVDEPEWKNDLGETWSLDRIIHQELAQPVVTAPEGGLDRLMGLSFAITRREKSKQPLDGQYQRAQQFVAEFHDFAFDMQNSDGSWGPAFLATRSESRDAGTQLRSTGRILEWLVTSLPSEKLEGNRVATAVDYVARILGSESFHWNTPALSTRDIAAAGHALHALSVYDERVFKPADPLPGEKKPADEKPAATTASRDDQSS